MVCKEDVLLWFKDLESYNRIDLLYELLNMCLPFELRFLGSCVEEIGRYSYQELRGTAISANDVDKLLKDSSLLQGLLDENVRHRVLLYLSLLSSRNYSVANWFYKNLLKIDWLEDCIGKGNLKDENVQREFLLLFVMALHHPAFNFEQKLYFKYIFTQLVELRECKKRISPNPSGYGYPPGFGYPTSKFMNTQEIPNVPAKTPNTIPGGDDSLQQPACLSQTIPPSQEYLSSWSIPGFHCRAPEVTPPFPTIPTVSPLVSESTSPNRSRSTSPHRMNSMRSPQMAPLPRPSRPADSTISAQLLADPLSSNNFSFHFPHTENAKTIEEDLNSIPEEKLPDPNAWPPIKDSKPANGLRYSHSMKNGRPFHDHFHSLSIDEPVVRSNTSPLQRSNSDSSGSSLNQTPPETPPVVATPKPPRVNGLPYAAPICDTASPPPPTFNNVPYSQNCAYASFPPLPTRSVFPYAQQNYRPPFAHFPSFQSGDSTFTYSLPLMLPFYSSHIQTRTPNCYNCGQMGHSGQDCTAQNIEDITQKKAYTLEFATLPDGDK